MSKLEVTEFLLYLAKNANKNRFYPFPNEFRLESKSSTETFAPYTSNEFDNVHRLIKEIIANHKSDKHEILLKYIESTPIRIAFHGNSIYKDINEYQFKYDPSTEQLINYKNKQRWYLYHGSPLGNWHSIIRNGIRNMSNTQFMTTGAAYGNGVYASDSLLIAQSYGNCVAVIELFEDSAKFQKVPNIFVIPDNVTITIRYLYKIKHHVQFTGTDALEFYKKNIESCIAAVPYDKFKKRIIREIESIESAFGQVICNYPSYTITTLNLTLILDGFPFTAPIIFINNEHYKYDIDTWSPRTSLVDLIYITVKKHATV